MVSYSQKDSIILAKRLCYVCKDSIIFPKIELCFKEIILYLVR